MFSIQFCVCFYSILYVCQSHFIVNINITKKDKPEMKTNLNTLNTTDETIIPKNNTIVENLAENVSKIHVSIDKTIEKNKSIDKIDESLLKKYYSIFGTNLTMNDSSSSKQLIVTGKTVKTAGAYYLENKTASRIKSKLIEGGKQFNITKKYIVEDQNTTVKNDVKTKILQNNENLTMISKNNVDMTKIFQNYDNMTNISQTNDKFIIIFQNNNNVTKISQMNVNITEIFQKNNGLLKTAGENGFSKNVESNNMTKKSENDDLPKNVKKRDIGMPGQVPNDYKPQDFQNHNARNSQNYDIHKNIKNYDMPKNIQQNGPRNIAQKPKKVHNINYYKPYYQNYKIKNKNFIDKTALRKKDGHTRFFDDSHKIIPQIQTRLNNDLVKKSFDEFKMVRRKTHFTMPDIPIQNDISKREIERYQYLNYNPKFHEYYDEGRTRNHVELNYYTREIPNNILYPPDQEINHLLYPVYDEMDSMPNTYKELNKILGRQKDIIQKLTNLQMAERQKKNSESDFDKLMDEVEKKQKTTIKFNARIGDTKTTTTAKPATVLTLFDETEVRLALKNDPNVRRLLKIGNLKREKYLKRVKTYLERKNYTLENGTVIT